MNNSALKIVIVVACLLSSVGALGQYFQQDVAYTINVALDDQKHILQGSEEVVYINNSPDTLEFIYFHIWPNAYSTKRTALAKQLVRFGETSLFFADDSEMGYIDSLSFTLDGKLCLWEIDEENPDICKVHMEKPLGPGETVTISTPFKVKVPSGSISRLGHIGESYQITQWYPKPAVYDTAGWHQMPYLTIGEFYSEFGSFDVFITVPENYVVGATGDLQNQDEIDWLNQLAEKTERWLAARTKSGDWKDYADSLDFPPSSEKVKTLHFSQKNVHDFAWFADKRYHVLKDTVTLPWSKADVTVWTMFTNKKAKLWKESIEYMSDAVYYYSLWNGDYPYKHANAVDGTISAGGGMEYPNITVIGDVGDPLSLETVIMHEVGHNWFYGILGSNERRYPFLDEGLNSYNEQRYLSTKYPDGKLLSKSNPNAAFKFAGLDYYDIEDQHELTSLLMARANRDQPMDIPANEYSFLNYGFVVYSKSATVFNYLQHYLSDSIMDRGMQRYFEGNKFHHPYPNSLQNALEAESGEDLEWFFKDVISTTDRIDYKIKRVTSDEGKTNVALKNRGINAPLHLALKDDKGQIVWDSWIDGFDRDTLIQINEQGEQVIIDPDDVMPEHIRDNNHSNTKGLLKRTEPIRMKFLGSVEKPTLNQVFYSPIIGWNLPSGWMPGLALYNITLPTRKFTYVLAPMFSTRAIDAVGTGHIGYSIMPNGSGFENIELSVSGKRYVYDWTAGNDSRYNRINPSATFYLRPVNYAGLLSQKFILGSVLNITEQPGIDPSGALNYINTEELYNRLEYHLKYGHPVFASGAVALIEQTRDFVRSSIELKERIKLDNVSFGVRLFAGAFLANSTTSPIYNWRMDGQDSRIDYAFDGEFLGRSRNDQFLNRQFMETHGGFKTPTAIGQSTRWLVAANFKASLNKLPFGLFMDVGSSASEPLVADAGVYYSLIPEFVEVYLPLLYSSSIQSEVRANSLAWHDLIRFQLRLDRLNLVEKAKRLEI